MNAIDAGGFGFDTLSVRAGQSRTGEQEHSDPLFLTSSFVFANAREAAARFANEAPGNVYSRFTNPTVRAFERRLAALEGGTGCIATASGMSAILVTAMVLLRAGDHVIAADGLFGSTISLFANVLTRFGIETTFVGVTDADAWAGALRPETKMLFAESPTNPLGEVADIAALGALARAHGAVLVIDNCLCTPALSRPLELGAGIVVHSATKYLDGQGRCVGGAVVTSDAAHHDALFSLLRTAGPSMSPFNAWVFLNGLETLRIRMHAISENAVRLARWLEDHPAVRRVYYPGLEIHPGHALAARQQSAGGGIVAFDVHGGPGTRRGASSTVSASCRSLRTSEMRRPPSFIPPRRPTAGLRRSSARRRGSVSRWYGSRSASKRSRISAPTSRSGSIPSRRTGRRYAPMQADRPGVHGSRRGSET